MYNPLLSGQAGVPWAPPGVPDPHPALTAALLRRPVQDPRPRQPGDKHCGQRLAQVIIRRIWTSLSLNFVRTKT